MRTFVNLLVFSTVAAALSAATISTTTHCYSGFGVIESGSFGGGQGSPEAGCFANGYDSFRDIKLFNNANARVLTTPTSVSAVASYSVYRFAPFNVSATASYTNDFEVTFFGGTGFGFFVPCVSVSGPGGQTSARVTLLAEPVEVPGLGTGSSVIEVGSSPRQSGSDLCANAAHPGNFHFAFGEPVHFSLQLAASADENIGIAPDVTSTAAFRFAFNISTFASSASGGVQLIPLPHATWTLENLSVPEPASAGLLAAALAFIVAYNRHR